MKPSVRCLLSLLVALLLPGCMSGVYQTTLPPRAAAHPGMGGNAKYTIAQIRLQVRGKSLSSSGIIALTPKDSQSQPQAPAAKMALTEETWREMLNTAAAGRHPALFTTTYPAVPLAVSIDASTDNSIGASIAAEICTLCVLGGVLPLPFKEEAQITVSVMPLEANGAAAQSFAFTRKNNMWITIFTPFGLIPYPARTDIPRSTMALPLMLDIPAMTKESWRIYGFTADCIVEGIIREMEKNPKAFAAARQPLPPVASPPVSGQPPPNAPPPPIVLPPQPPPTDDQVY